ncbi:MAG: stalk domain-containing protein [Clostridiales bacterium]|nr:stalk domain-containing protein [Clostridiales bacterium]
MKRIIQITLAATLFLLSASFIFATEVSVIIDGEPVEFTQESGRPFIDANNRTLTPFRQTLEAFGATVDWDQNAHTAIARKGDITVRVPISSWHFYANDLVRVNDTGAVIRDGRTYLPIRMILESFGAAVFWDGENRAIIVVSKGETIPIKGIRFNTALTELTLSGTHLHDEDIVYLRYMENLERLTLTNIQISDFSPLSELTNLKELNLNFNQVSDLSPLSGLYNLERMNLGINQISDISTLSNFTSVRVLQLHHNQISDISPLSELTGLELWLFENPITDWSPVAHIRTVSGRP